MVSLASEMDPLDSFPGCMGRMINMFDDGTSITRTKMATERPHRDGTSPNHIQVSGLL